MSIGVEFSNVVNSAPFSLTCSNIFLSGIFAKSAHTVPFFHISHGMKFTALTTAQSSICTIVLLTLNSKSCIV